MRQVRRKRKAMTRFGAFPALHRKCADVCSRPLADNSLRLGEITDTEGPVWQSNAAPQSLKRISR